MLAVLITLCCLQESGPVLPPPQDKTPTPKLRIPVPPAASKSDKPLRLPTLTVPSAPPKATSTSKSRRPQLVIPERTKPFSPPPEAQKLIRELALVGMPHEFEDDKKWEQTRRIRAGIEMKLEDGRLRANPRWKNVNHGKWQKFNAVLIKPEEKFDIRVENMSRTADGATEFDLLCEASLRATGRWQDWRLGIPLLRLSVECTCDIRLNARCRMEIDWITESFPPAIELKPTVLKADVRIGKLKVKRVSHLKGRLASQFSKTIESVLKRELTRRRKELPSKINRQIDKKRDRMKISFGDWSRAMGTGTKAESAGKMESGSEAPFVPPPAPPARDDLPEDPPADIPDDPSDDEVPDDPCAADDAVSNTRPVPV